MTQGTADAAVDRRRLRVEIQGAVQGVGFRPFVYRLASELELAGWVINDTSGVFIEVEGPDATLERFLERLPAEVPPLAIVQSLDCAWLPPAGYDSFQIRHSDDHGAKTVFVLPDIATCPACLQEILDPADRRCGYPFTNCTNCGPRFTIIEALPYDRPNTSMRRFTMCPDCLREYQDPRDRRFHAQPNACPVCGPQLTMLDAVLAAEGSIAFDAQSAIRNSQSTVPSPQSTQSAILAAAAALRAGRIVAVKGLGGFHLMVDARNGTALRRLREHKPRHAKPFAVMARDMDQARALCEVSDLAQVLFELENGIPYVFVDNVTIYRQITRRRRGRELVQE
ncbi:MAG: acylphosphatase, partial [Planctomycetes bacterium]|nr:acylphosphatase [Planctomycetota bacterium]